MMPNIELLFLGVSLFVLVYSLLLLKKLREIGRAVPQAVSKKQLLSGTIILFAALVNCLVILAAMVFM